MLWMALFSEFMVVQTRVYEGSFPMCRKIKEGYCGKQNDSDDTEQYFKLDD